MDARLGPGRPVRLGGSVNLRAFHWPAGAQRLVALEDEYMAYSAISKLAVPRLRLLRLLRPLRPLRQAMIIFKV